MERPTVDRLLNRITFLSKALEYYADQTTYACKNGVAPIDIDRGHQAKFALEQVEEIKKYNEKLLEDFDKALNSDQKIELSEEDMVKIEQLNKLIEKHNTKHEN